MRIDTYFEKKKGIGVLSTSDGSGHVDTAIYAKPHVIGEGRVAFIMADRRTHTNIQSNPHAAYLFKEDGEGYTGVRLYLTKTGEEKNSDRLRSLLKRKKAEGEGAEGGDGNQFLVEFRVDKVLGLTGKGRCPVAPVDAETGSG